jgi:hypothetical protein
MSNSAKMVFRISVPTDHNAGTSRERISPA